MSSTPAALMVPELADEPGFVHGFSTTALGTVGLKHAPDPGPVMASRRAFVGALGLDGAELTTIGSVHGSAVARVDAPGGSVDDVDALVTDRRGVALFATYADCFPIVLWDPKKRAAGLIHAGWRGTRAGVTAAAVRFMQAEFGCTYLRAGIGPGICRRCYQVGEDVASQFDRRYVRPDDGPPHEIWGFRGGPGGGRFLLDLAAANRAQLEEAGVKAIYDIGMCTKESYLFPSHRRHPDGSRFGAIVALR